VPDPIRPLPAAGADWSRRSVLALGLAAGQLAWAGCTVSDPTIRTGPGGPAAPTSQTATPTPHPSGPGTARDAAAELVLAVTAGTLASRRTGGSPAHRAVLELIRRTHAERAAALASPDPADRPTSPAAPTPSPRVPGGASLRRLADAERRVARRYRSAAFTSSGPTALLWGSMAVASTRFAAAVEADAPPPAGPPREHRAMPQLSDSEAVSALVSSLHAAVYGYQLALGRLAVGSAAQVRASRGLADRRALLNRLSDGLVAAGVEVPPAAPAYDPSPEVRDAATARLVIRRMESALLPFCGLWLAAAARPADRRSAFETLADTAVRAESWGAPLQAWPGWQD